MSSGPGRRYENPRDGSSICGLATPRSGRLEGVAGTPFDFREPARIGSRIDAADPQLARGLGYDHNFVVRRTAPGLVHAARVVEPASGRMLDVHTKIDPALTPGASLDRSLHRLQRNWVSVLYFHVSDIALHDCYISPDVVLWKTASMFAMPSLHA